jgi:2-haloacid dehalogenase
MPADMAHRPAAVVFDVVETLMSLRPLADRLEQVGQPASLLPTWFARLLLYGVGLSASGDYVPFPAAAKAALRAAARGNIVDADVDFILAGFDELPAHPDAQPALERLASAGIRLACLTNGTAHATSGFLARNRLDRYFEKVISAAEVGSWKPPARVYQHALKALVLPAEQVALVAVHAWDCHGAKRAGLTTGWAARAEGDYGDIFTRPDVTGANLIEVADGLLALPRGDAAAG